jgi:hypothetical protein
LARDEAQHWVRFSPPKTGTPVLEW